VSSAGTRRTGLGRKLVAGLAAYIFALQLVLPTFALAQLISASLSDGVICASHADAGEHGPTSDHDSICPCGPACAMTGGSAVMGPAPASHAIAWLGIATTYRFALLPSSGFQSRPIASGPHNPRAPPTA
jgi:hypothetical protein